MKRRAFVEGLASAALAWPLAGLAQRTAIPFIGFLNSGSPNERAHLVAAFLRGLKEAAMLTVAMSRSNIVGPKDAPIGYRRWRPNW